MPWQHLVGHDAIVDQFRRAIAHGRLASTFLFLGPPGIGKKAFAVRFAQALLCERSSEERLDPCGHCPACQQVVAGSHPDLEIVGKPKDRSFIPVETFIGDRGHRMSEGLCHNISLKPYCGGRKVAIIDDADYLNEEGANCLLKTLEEPPPRSVLILIGTSEQKQLPTIRSRCQIVRFQPLPRPVVAELLVSRGLVENPADAQPLADLAEGNLQQAVELADPAMREFRAEFLERLSRCDWVAPTLAKTTGEFVDAAGKEAPPRRDRLRLIIGFATDFFQQLMRALSGAESAGDPLLRRAVDGARRTWRGDSETAAACLERCLVAESQVSRNANQATLIEAWLDELQGRMTLRQWGPVD